MSEFSVGDTVYFPDGPFDFDPGVPHKVVCVDPFQVTVEIGGRSFGPYMLTKHEVATCGMTREAQR